MGVPVAEWSVKDGTMRSVAEEISKYNETMEGGEEEPRGEYTGKVWTPPRPSASVAMAEETEVTLTTISPPKPLKEEDETARDISTTEVVVASQENEQVEVELSEEEIKQQVLEFHKQRRSKSWDDSVDLAVEKEEGEEGEEVTHSEVPPPQDQEGGEDENTAVAMEETPVQSIVESEPNVDVNSCPSSEDRGIQKSSAVEESESIREEEEEDMEIMTPIVEEPALKEDKNEGEQMEDTVPLEGNQEEVMTPPMQLSKKNNEEEDSSKQEKIVTEEVENTVTNNDANHAEEEGANEPQEKEVIINETKTDQEQNCATDLLPAKDYDRARGANDVSRSIVETTSTVANTEERMDDPELLEEPSKSIPDSTTVVTTTSAPEPTEQELKQDTIDMGVASPSEITSLQKDNESETVKQLEKTVKDIASIEETGNKDLAENEIKRKDSESGKNLYRNWVCSGEYPRKRWFVKSSRASSLMFYFSILFKRKILDPSTPQKQIGIICMSPMLAHGHIDARWYGPLKVLKMLLALHMYIQLGSILIQIKMSIEDGSSDRIQKNISLIHLALVVSLPHGEKLIQ